MNREIMKMKILNYFTILRVASFGLGILINILILITMLIINHSVIINVFHFLPYKNEDDV